MAQSAKTDSSELQVGYQTEYDDTERADVGAALSVMAVEEPALSVEAWPNEGDGTVALKIHNDLLRGKFVIDPEAADWLAGQLADRADQVRQG